MRVIRDMKSKKFGSFQTPTIILLILLHLNQMILLTQRLSKEAFTFNGSVATIHNYLDQFANKDTVFEYQGYPTSNLKEYNPGPFPYMYILKFSWLMHERYDINPIYLSNLLLAIYPTILIFLAISILYRSNLKVLAITTAALSLLLNYANPQFNGSNISLSIFDWGYENITMLSALTLLMVFLSFKRPDSSHVPLLFFSGLLYQSHFLALSLAPFAILYAFYSIILSIRTKRYRLRFRLLIPTIFIIYMPIIYRFIIDPLYLYRSFKINNPGSKHKQASGLAEEIYFFYQTTPLAMYKDACQNEQSSNCISIEFVNIYIILLLLIMFLIIILALRGKNFFVKFLIITSLILININTFNGYDEHHNSIAAGLMIAVLIYYIAKYKNLYIIFAIATLLVVNLDSRREINISNINKENFSKEWMKSMKPYKFKINICELSEVGICSKSVLSSQRVKGEEFFRLYGGDNHAQVTLIELLKNKIDVCLYNNNLGLERLERLRCTDKEDIDKKRFEIFFISSRNNMTPNILLGYNKIGEIVDRRGVNCLNYEKTKEFPGLDQFSKAIDDSSCYEPFGFNITNESTSLYIKKDSIDINSYMLLYKSNLQIEKVMLEIQAESNSLIAGNNNCTSYKLKICKTDSDLFISVNENLYNSWGELYEFR